MHLNNLYEKLRNLFIVLLLFIPVTTFAELRFQTHGFLTQSYIKSENNNFFGNSQGKGSIDFTEIGLNASIRPQSRLHASTQILYREAGKSDESSVDLDFAIVDYHFYTSQAFGTGFRGGRIKNPLGYYNETRDVAFTRPGVILPQSIYFDRVRDFALSSDGGQIYGFFSTADVDTQFQFSAAKPNVSTDSEIALFSRNLPGSLEPSLSYGSKISFDFFQGKFNLSYSEIHLFLDYEPDASESLTNPGLEFVPRVLSGRLSVDRIILSFEYALRKFKFQELSNYLPYKNLTGESYYLQMVYLIHHNFRLLTRYDITYLNKDDRNGEKFLALTGGTRPAYSQFAKDFTIGAQWEINRSWLLMVEQHWVEGVAWLPIQDNLDISQANPNFNSLEKHWWMFNFLVSYRF